MRYNHEQIIELRKQLKEIEHQYQMENTLFHCGHDNIDAFINSKEES